MQVVGTPKRVIYECCFDSVAGFDVANLVEPHLDILSCVAHDCSPRLQGANRNCNRRRMGTVALYPNDVGLDLLTLERYIGCANCAGSIRGGGLLSRKRFDGDPRPQFESRNLFIKDFPTGIAVKQQQTHIEVSGAEDSGFRCCAFCVSSIRVLDSSCLTDSSNS